ncbi:MAG TPA: hypothetical protein VJ692_02170 [Nitrospiraceae bacterium]|nr:hypothetical protein [Nitrospiraceae bacterium]
MLTHRRLFHASLFPILLTVLSFAFPFQPDVTAAKRKPAPIKPPELRIVTVTASPEPYIAGDGTVNFNVEVELPKDFEEGTLLEVSSLISSPSMSSMRFISARQPMSSPDDVIATASSSMKPRVSVTLTWDGMDQAKQQVEGGRYHYEIRAKLLTVRENVPRTLMNAWPKRGSLLVK